MRWEGKVDEKVIGRWNICVVRLPRSREKRAR